MFKNGGAFLCLFIASSLCAQTLDWGRCLEMAAAYHPDLIQANESVSQASSDVKSARSNTLPSVDLTASVVENSRSGVESQSSSVGLSASQTLFDSGKTSSALRSARDRLTVAEIAREQASAQLRYDLRVAYLNLWDNAQQLDILQAIYDLREGNARLVSLRYDSGTENKGAFEQAQAKLAQSAFDLSSTQRNSTQLLRELAQAVGTPSALSFDDVAAPLPPEVDLTQTPDFTELARATLPYATAQAQLKVAQASVSSAQAGYGPSVSLTASAGTSGADLTPDDDDSLSVGLSVRMPIFDFGSRSAALQKARSSVRSAQAALLSAENEQVVALGNAWDSLCDAYDALGVQASFLTAAKTRNRIANSQYEVGLISYDDWTIIEDAYVSAQKQYLSAQLAYQRQWAAWQQTLGVTL